MLEGYLIFDIETTANDRIDEYIEKKDFKPRGNLVDPKKIAQDITFKRKKAREEAALSWITGKVICIVADDILSNERYLLHHKDEVANLHAFFDLIVRKHYKYVVGKYSEMFDRPFVIGRALFHNIGIPRIWQRDIHDIDHIFSRSSQCSQITNLEDFSFGLGIPGKVFDSSKVPDLYKEGKMDEILLHCGQDVSITKELFTRYMKTYVPIGGDDATNTIK